MHNFTSFILKFYYKLHYNSPKIKTDGYLFSLFVTKFMKFFFYAATNRGINWAKIWKFSTIIYQVDLIQAKLKIFRFKVEHDLFLKLDLSLANLCPWLIDVTLQLKNASEKEEKKKRRRNWYCEDDSSWNVCVLEISSLKWHGLFRKLLFVSILFSFLFWFIYNIFAFVLLLLHIRSLSSSTNLNALAVCFTPSDYGCFVTFFSVSFSIFLVVLN